MTELTSELCPATIHLFIGFHKLLRSSLSASNTVKNKRKPLTKPSTLNTCAEIIYGKLKIAVSKEKKSYFIKRKKQPALPVNGVSGTNAAPSASRCLGTGCVFTCLHAERTAWIETPLTHTSCPTDRHLLTQLSRWIN